MCDCSEQPSWVEKSRLYRHTQRSKRLLELLDEKEITPQEKYVIAMPPYMRRFDMQGDFKAKYGLEETMCGRTREEMKNWLEEDQEEDSAVKHPDHYNWHPEAECIDIIAEFSWCRGEAIKYIWRAGRKDSAKEIEDLKKAIECLQAEVKRLENG